MDTAATTRTTSQACRSRPEERFPEGFTCERRKRLSAGAATGGMSGPSRLRAPRFERGYQVRGNAGDRAGPEGEHQVAGAHNARHRFRQLAHGPDGVNRTVAVGVDCRGQRLESDSWNWVLARRVD